MDVEDPAERDAELNKLRELALEHAKMEEDFDVKKKTVEHVTQKLNQVSDLEIEKVRFSMLDFEFSDVK